MSDSRADALLKSAIKKYRWSREQFDAAFAALQPPAEITEEFLAKEFPALCDVEITPVKVIVQDHLIRGGIHILAGMFESYKTMSCMELSAAIINKRKAFDQFEVYESHPVILGCPDMSLDLVNEYAAPFGLASKEVGNKFRVMAQKNGVIHAVDSPVMQAVVKDHILILDTMWDFAGIQKAFESGEWATFFQKLRRLTNQFGCVAIIMLVHPTKTGARAKDIDPAEFAKDSATFGGKFDIGFAYSHIQNTSQIFVQRIKGRGFKERKFTYTITTHSDDGVNYLNQGRFPVHLEPGKAGKKSDHAGKAGRKPDEHRDKKVAFLMTLSEDLTAAEKTVLMNEKFTSDHTQHTVKTWLARESGRKKMAAKAAAEAAEMAALQGTFVPDEQIEEEKEVVQ